MMRARNAAAFSMVGLLIALTAPADAARPIAKRNAATAHTIHGIVVNQHSKPVAGAHVHLEHHRRHTTAAAAAAKTAQPAKPKVARAHAHHGIVSAANGTFSMKHRRTGAITLVAHKKNEGTGHARVTVGSNTAANVTIRLHKHHHHHS